MRSHLYSPLATLLLLVAPQIATPQANQPVAILRGSDKAPITILVFSDFESFPCARSASVIDGLLQQTRDVRVIFKHAPAATNPNALLAHEAALAAGAQGKFWEMHDTLFENQTKLTRADLLGYAKLLGLDLAAFQQALDNHTYRPIIERDLAEAAALGVTTTPTFFVNGRRLVGPQGYASLGAVIESLLAGIPLDKRVREEIVAAGPAQQIDLAHAPTRGPATAPISLVEFSDFECPYCAMTAPVVRQLLLAYPTQVRFAFKHYPLPMHKDSPLAHEAALAAADQGKFWGVNRVQARSSANGAESEPESPICARTSSPKPNNCIRTSQVHQSPSPDFLRCANIVLSSGWVTMDYDRDKVDEMVLALLCLTIWEEDDGGARAWKSHDWGALDRLHAKGYISDPKSKTKSVVLSPEGLKRARMLFARHFR